MSDTERVPESRLRRWRTGLTRELEALTAPVARAAEDRRYLFTAVLVAALVYLVSARLRLAHGLPSGDEPAYLILGQTMQKYHSLNVLLDYQHRDYWSFYPGPLDPHVVPAPNGSQQPLHSPGGPLLWLLPFILWGRTGAVLFIAAVSVLVVGNTYAFLRERRIAPGYALVVTVLMAIGSPLYTYAAMSFIEPIAALIIIYATRVLLAHRPHPARLAVASLGLGYAPWVHPRLLTFSVMIGGLLIARVWLDRGLPRLASYACVLLPLAAGALSVEVQALAVWHSLNPAGSMSTAGNGPFQVPIWHGAAGLLFDKEFGLVTNFPLFLLVLPGILVTLKRECRLLHAILAIIVAPYLVLIATFFQWYAGFSPPARFLAVLVPLFAYPVAALLQRARDWWLTLGAVVLGLAGYVLALTGDIFPIERFMLEGKENLPMNRLGKLIGHPFAHFAPSGWGTGQAGKFWAWTALLVGVGVAVALYALWRSRSTDATPPAAPRIPSQRASEPEPVAV